MAKVIVGMSGGVDSAVAAYLLKKQGYEVIGVTLRTWTSQEGEESRCCEIDDARRIADRIGIGYRTLNCEQAFRQSVIEPFVQEYVSGKTPNPCVICNRRVKWEWMTYLAGVLQADYVATGHYASIVQLENGRYTVKRASSKKDQAYMLYRLSQEQLSRTLLPLSDLTKDEVRAIAEEAQLPVAHKKDSQEICFIPDNDHAKFILSEEGQEEAVAGNFVDADGNILASLDDDGNVIGIWNYSISKEYFYTFSDSHVNMYDHSLKLIKSVELDSAKEYSNCECVGNYFPSRFTAFAEEEIIYRAGYVETDILNLQTGEKTSVDGSYDIEQVPGYLILNERESCKPQMLLDALKEQAGITEEIRMLVTREGLLGEDENGVLTPLEKL